MTLKFLKRGLLLAAFVLLTPFASHAAVDRAVVTGFEDAWNAPGYMWAYTQFYDGSTKDHLETVQFPSNGIYSTQQLFNTAEYYIQGYATGQGYSLSTLVWPSLDTASVQSLIDASISNTPRPATTTASTLSLSLQTSTGAVGTQVSTTTAAWVAVAGQTSVTSTIAGASSGDIIVETAPTNSATSTDWVEWGRIGTSQSFSLAIALQGVQVIKGQVMAYLPAGWYVKARSVGSGTFTNTLNTVKKVL